MLPGFATLALFGLSVYLLVLWQWRKYFKFTAQLHGPPAYPVIGSLHRIVGRNLRECFDALNEACLEFSTPFRVWLGPLLVVFVGEPQDVDVILSSPVCLEKAFFYKFFECEKGLISAPAKTWKVHRKLLNSSFNLKILKSFITIFNEKSLIMCDKVQAQMIASKEPFNFEDILRNPIVDMIGATTLGTQINMSSRRSNGPQAGAAAMEKFTEKVTLRMFKFWHHFDFIYKKSNDYRQLQTSKDRASKLSSRIIELKMEAMHNEKTAEIGEHEAEEYRKPQIFINKLLQLNKEHEEFDDIAIRDEIRTMFAAGSETTMLTLAHAILLLAINQNIQEKVVDELRSVLYDVHEVPDYDCVTKLKYTNMVLKETMRLLPPVPFIARTVTEDLKLATKDAVIPAGVMTIIPIHIINRDPRHWGPNSHEFNPDNFTPENSSKRHPCSYIPFSYGSRNCIGYNYAMISLIILLAQLLRRFKFNTTYTMDTIDKRFHFTLKLQQGCIVTVEPRDF